MKSLTVFSKMAVCIGALFYASVTSAGMVTLVGDTINYVYDDTQAGLGLYGTPTIVGDAVVFTPATFRAESLNGAPTDTLLVDFVFSSVYSTGPGGFLGPVQVIEAGDYSIGGGAVAAAVGARIEDNNSAFMVEGVVDLSESDDTGNALLWELAGSLNGGPLTDIQLTLRNLIEASSVGAGDYAWIQKKQIFLTASPDFLVLPPAGPGFPGVPAPGVLMLMGLGLTALGWTRRRKSK